MKTLLILIFLTTFKFLISSYSEPILTVDKNLVNLGKLARKDKKIALFKITNTGKETLIINNVKADCQCTVAQLSSKNIPPSKSTILKVSIDDTVIGWFQKVITLESNIHEKKTILVVRGKVSID